MLAFPCPRTEHTLRAAIRGNWIVNIRKCHQRTSLHDAWCIFTFPKCTRVFTLSLTVNARSAPNMLSSSCRFSRKYPPGFLQEVAPTFEPSYDVRTLFRIASWPRFNEPKFASHGKLEQQRSNYNRGPTQQPSTSIAYRHSVSNVSF